ncbi:IgGFc-binding protein-like [Saccostrea echinata]|uniref:IgGFc-binding protein-like n=1 Tax=Saccostrea echinata TaxID=191078 RepID=UPI002A7F48BB|nr:IgGFc-binding protein-like [Saccostrea echinata]
MPCQNGGTCQDTDTSYTCTCNTGWTGENCTRFEGDFNHEYALMIMLNHYYASNESSLIYMTTNTSATVEISTSNNMEPSLKSAIDRTFFFTTQLKVTLPPEMQSMSFQKEAKAVKIRSTQPITVVLFDNNYLQSNDGSLIFPVEKLDTRYLVMSTEPRDEMHPIYASVFGIVALEDETLVKINFKLDNNARPLTINGKNYSDSDTFEISLNDLETLQLEHSADLTGTLVEASKPVAVFSGNRCNMFPESIRCSHLMEQMTPISHFGNSYCVSADFTSDVTRLSIMTEESVPTRGAIIVGYSVHSMKLIPRVPFEFTLRANETAYVFLASPRVFVTSLVKGNKNNGSPYMVTIPDTSQYKSQYIIPIPEGYSTNYITILIALRFKADLRLNGQVLQQEKILFEGRNVMNEGMLGSFFTMEVPPGVLNITTITGSPFGLTVFGYRYLDSYGFAGNIV